MSENLLRVLVVDDEPLARERARRLVEKCGGCEIVAEASTGRQALAKIEEHEPDVVLLDINLPDLDGLRVLEALDDPPAVIFSTAYEHHAIRAFDLEATDYLLKPYSAERLGRALDRVRRRLIPKAAALDVPHKIPALDGRETLLLDAGELLKICIESGVVFLYAANGSKLIYEGNLQQLEEKLPSTGFLRINRQCVINLAAIRSYQPSGQGGFVLTLQDNSRENVSRRRARFLKADLGNTE